MKLIEVKTNRQDTLIGCWYGENFRDICVIITNGTGGNIFENKFLRVIGEELENVGLSYICAHNSGAFQIIDLPSLNGNRSGLTFELFDNCVEDLQAYVDFAKKQGYKKIIIGGHSLGCNKVVYYLHSSNSNDIDKYILISPTDMEKSTTSEKESINKLKAIANDYKTNGKIDEIMPQLFDGYNFYTAKSFLDYIENPHHNNIPVYSDKENFYQLQTIDIKGLYVMGEKDAYAYNDALKHLNTINNHSKNKNNIIKVINDTGHTYRNKEIELAQAIIDFIK